MKSLHFERKNDGSWRAQVGVDGRHLLTSCLVNKGTAFSVEERERFHLTGLLPEHVSTIEEQVAQTYDTICVKQEPLERYIGMASLQDRNETLFFRLLLEHIEELMPIVYTPTVGEACQKYSRIFRRGRGMWITPSHRGKIASVLGNAPSHEVRLIVVTDNERILGLGDQGAGGMGIPIGKLALYTAAAGIHPSQVLPISLDVGTDNQRLLDDPLYLGYRHPRLRGEPYGELVEELVQAVRQRFPNALLQWEDFKKGNAFELLDRYRQVLPSFNDDIEGTAAVALAGLFAACRAKQESLAKQRIVILGAGAAGVGIGRQLRDALGRAGLSGSDLKSHVAVLDSRGLVIEGKEGGDVYKRELAWPAELAKSQGLDPDADLDLAALVDTLRPDVLIGTSGQPGAFSEAIVRSMAKHTERPIIFPFSNPTNKSEATPEDLLAWTDGRALVATGSPFDPVQQGGRTHRIAQGNNVYVFPGVGLGVLAAEARSVSDAMFTTAAEVLAQAVEPADLEHGALFPRLTKLREVSRAIAIAVVEQARKEGVARAPADAKAEDLVDHQIWYPEYPELSER